LTAMHRSFCTEFFRIRTVRASGSVLRPEIAHPDPISAVGDAGKANESLTGCRNRSRKPSGAVGTGHEPPPTGESPFDVRDEMLIGPPMGEQGEAVSMQSAHAYDENTSRDGSGGVAAEVARSRILLPGLLPQPHRPILRAT
jgi:hypothetical protein